MIVLVFSAFNVSVYFRYAGRAGHSYGPIEPNVKYELYGPLHETRRPLAETGQPEGKVTINLWTLQAAPLSLYFTSVFNSDTDLDCPSGSCQFSLLHMDINSSKNGRQRCPLMWCNDTTLIIALVIYCFLSCPLWCLSLSHTFMNMGYICCYSHISCLAPTLYLAVPLLHQLRCGIMCDSQLFIQEWP